MGMQPCNCNINLGGFYGGYTQFGMPMPRMSFAQNYFLDQANLFTGMSITNPVFTYPAQRASYMADWFGAVTTNRYFAGSNGQLYAFEPEVPQEMADAARGFGINPFQRLQQGFQCSLATAALSLIYNVTTDKINKTLTCCHKAFDSAFEKDESGKVDYTKIKAEFKEKMTDEQQNQLIDIMAKANDIEKEVKEILAKPASQANAKRMDEILKEVNTLFQKDGVADKLRENLATIDKDIQAAKKKNEKPAGTTTGDGTEEVVEEGDDDVDEQTSSTSSTSSRTGSTSLSQAAQEAKENITVQANGLPDAIKAQLDKASTFIAQIADLDPKPNITTTQENNYSKSVIKFADGRVLVLKKYNDGKMELLVNFDTTPTLIGDKRIDGYDVKYIIEPNKKMNIIVDADKNGHTNDKMVKNVATNTTNELIRLINIIFSEEQPPLSASESYIGS